jgi:hypothetical protein
MEMKDLFLERIGALIISGGNLEADDVVLTVRSTDPKQPFEMQLSLGNVTIKVNQPKK